MAINYDLLKLTPPEPTIKYQSAQEFLSGSQAVRDARRKRAIEESVRSGIDAEGNLSTDAIRQSLIAQGFGEDADRVVREISMARLGDAASTADIGYKLSNMAAAGIIDPRIAENLFRTQNVPVYAEPEPDQSWTNGIPPSQATQPITAPDSQTDGTIHVRSTDMAPPQAAREVVGMKESRGAQAVPDYLKNMVQFGGVQGSSSGQEGSTSASRMSWNIPTEEELKKYALQTANALGYDMTSAAAPLQEQMRARAEAAVPQVAPFYPPMDPKDLAKARMEYEQKKLDRAAKVEELFSKQGADIEAGIRNYAGEKRAQAGEVRAESGERRAERGARISQNPLDPVSNPMIWKEVNESTLSEIEDGITGLADMEAAYKRYLESSSLGNLVDFAAGSLKAAGQPITLDGIESFILKSGAVPAESELKFKKALRDMNIADLVGFKALSWAELGVSPKPASKEILTGYMDNQKSDIFRKGGNVPGYTPTANDWFYAKGRNRKGDNQKASPEIGTIRTYSNGRKAKWDGKGWVAI